MLPIFLILCLFVSNIVSQEQADILEQKYTVMLEENLELSNRLDQAEKKLSLARNKLSDSESQLDRLGDPPASYHCAFQDRWGGGYGTGQIAYDKLFYSSSVGDLGSGLDLESGLFTAGWGGTYQVTWSLQNSDHNNEKSQGLQLLRNGESVPEVYFYTQYTDNSATKDEAIYQMTERNIYQRLEVGDSLALSCTEDCHHMYWINFCVKLDRPDYPGPQLSYKN